jgi:heme oxygenase
MIAPSIKRLTAGVHLEAEQTVRAFAPFASIDRYASYLACLRGFYEAIEPLLVERLDGIVDDTQERFAKRAAIAKDLAWLGEEGPPRPTPPRIPRLRCVASALGVAYVLEGKTLGARFLLSEARESLGLDVDRGASFLSGYGARTGAMWNGYRASLERWIQTNGRRRAVLEGARDTFASFIACVSSASPSRTLRLAAS